MATNITLPAVISVGALAEKLNIPVGKLIAELMKNGVMATVNEQIDFDTVQIIVGELGIDAELSLEQQSEVSEVKRHREKNTSGSLRPPVVAVMGHVDHGKTTLLDKIRGSHVTDKETGGITQHISACQVKHGSRLITFLDTPGHEAFGAIRSHAAGLTDLVVLVVAADDGIMPQTLEAIRYAASAGVKILVAINKIDKEGADVNRVKQGLAEQNLLPEEWGGDTVIQEVSAKTGQGVNELLDMILLMADVDELKAEDTGAASGLVIESHLEKGRGPVASLLIESGKLNKGDFVAAGGVYGKVRDMRSSQGDEISQAGPSTPVEVTGFKSVPDFGKEFSSYKTEKLAREQAKTAADSSVEQGRHDIASADLINMINRKHDLKELNILVKADVQGSVTSVVDSLKALNTEEVAVRVIGTSVGNVTENDLSLAKSAGAIVYGFNIEMAASNRRLAVRDNVPVRIYKVIYELVDDAKEELSKLLAPEVVETDLGRLKIKAIFKTTKTEVICGGEVTKGRLTVPALARITRDGQELANDVKVTNLKRGPQDTKEIFEGELCGINLATTNRLTLDEGDVVDVFERKVHERQL